MNKTLTIIKRDRLTFYIFESTVTISNGEMQHTAYDTFGEWSSASFLAFKNKIEESTPEEISTISDVVELSSQLGVYGRYTRKPILDDYDVVIKTP